MHEVQCTAAQPSLSCLTTWACTSSRGWQPSKGICITCFHDQPCLQGHSWHCLEAWTQLASGCELEYAEYTVVLLAYCASDEVKPACVLAFNLTVSVFRS
jgi:hypothetical protein